MKYTWIEANRDRYSASRLGRLLSVSRSGYLQWRRRPPSNRALANAALDAQVAALHAESGRSYGRPRLVRALQKQGMQIGHERIRRSLRRQGLRCVYKRPDRVTTDSEHTQPVAGNVLDRHFEGWAPNAAWTADITFIATAQGGLCLACVLETWAAGASWAGRCRIA